MPNSWCNGCCCWHKRPKPRRPCNSPVSQLFSPGGKQPEQRVLVHKSEQPTAGCIAIFHKCCCYIKHGVIITNLTQWNPLGHVTYMPKAMVRVYGAWIRIYYVLCSKTHSTFGDLFFLAGSRRVARGAPAFVRLAYWPSSTEIYRS